MSDPNPTPDPAPSKKAESEKQGEPASDKPLGEGGEKALKAERERANELEKQLRAATARATELERANETAIEKAMREAQEAKAEVESVPQKVADQLRDYLVNLHDISEENAALYLTSNDPEVLLKQAAGISERAPTSPRPDPSQGSKGENTATSSGELFAAAVEGSFTR